MKTDPLPTEKELSTYLIEAQYKLKKELERKRTLWEWLTSIRERARIRREIEKLRPAIMTAMACRPRRYP